jgi:hypothetical protein
VQSLILAKQKYNWAIESGKDDAWATHLNVPVPLYSTCGQNEALVFEWRVSFNTNKGKGGTGSVDAQVGSLYKRGGTLKLTIGAHWRRC